MTRIKINSPGYFCNGREYDAEPVVLEVPARHTMSRARPAESEAKFQARWGALSSDGKKFTAPCFVMTDPDWGRFAMPASKCVVLS